jgi:hypothetical protein
MRRTPLPAAATCAATLAVLAGAFASCGDDALRSAVDAYRTRVEPYLVRDDQVWTTVEDLARDIGADPKGPRYFPYLESSAAPFYDEMRTALAAMAPAAEPLAAPHADLRRYADLRREFVRMEFERRKLLADPVVSSADEARIQAGIAETEYVEALRDELPDSRFAELGSLRDEVLLRMLPDLRAGRRDVGGAVEQIRRHVLPKLRSLRDARYAEDARSQALRRAVALADDAMRAFVDALPAHVALARATDAASANAREAEEARKRALEGLRRAAGEN